MLKPFEVLQLHMHKYGFLNFTREVNRVSWIKGVIQREKFEPVNIKMQ